MIDDENLSLSSSERSAYTIFFSEIASDLPFQGFLIKEYFVIFVIIHLIN
jgi:hypothetical protein